MHSSTPSVRLPIRDMAIFAVLGTIMFVSRISMQLFMSVHLLGLFIAAITLTYKMRALIPIYIYVMLDGIFAGFAFWWQPYLYIWLPLWLMFMIAGKFAIPKVAQVPLYMVLCGLHGLLFGIMYAPAWAFYMNLSFEATVAWIIAGLPADIIHCISNIALGTLIVPLTELLKKLALFTPSSSKPRDSSQQ